MNGHGRRHAPTDAAWARVAPLLPAPAGGRRGRPWRDHRTIIDALLWILRTGAPWRDLPARFGPWQTAYARLVRWRREGVWDRVLRALQRERDAAGGIDRSLFRVDGTSVRAHKATAGARRDTREAGDHALGRSRGGFGTKLHVMADGNGLPLAAVASAGQAHEARFLRPALAAVRVPRPGRGRPRSRPSALAGDRGHSYRALRRALRGRGVRPVIPERRDRMARRRGRPPNFDRDDYWRRNAVERWVGWLKERRRVATRFEKLAVNYTAPVTLAVIERFIV